MRLRLDERNGGAGGRTARSGRPRLYEIVREALAAEIGSGRLPGGAVLHQSEVAAAFGIGRVPAGMALDRLARDGLLVRRDGRGFCVAGAGAAEDVPALVASPAVRAELRVRSWRERIYPEVERDVAACLLFGRFQIRSQALAEHYGVSRTVAQELLTRLERVGIIRQEPNGRWYAGPLTAERLSELYEMRWLLEPAALIQAAPLVGRREIREMRARVAEADRRLDKSDVGLLHRLEQDLHQSIVLRCANRELRDTLYRCQLPTITGHLTFKTYAGVPGVSLMLEGHARILELLDEGDPEGAAQELRRHLRQAGADAPARLAILPPLDQAQIPAYLTPREA